MTETDICPNCGNSMTLDRDKRGEIIQDCEECGETRVTDGVVFTQG